MPNSPLHRTETPEELRRTIEEPARVGGWDLEPGPVDLLPRDVGKEPGALPPLPRTLLELEAAQGYLQVAMEEMHVDDPADISLNLWCHYGDEDFARTVVEQWETNFGIQVNVLARELEAHWETLGSCGGQGRNRSTGLLKWKKALVIVR